MDESNRIPAVPDPDPGDVSPCRLCGHPVNIDAYEGLPVTLWVEHGLSQAFQQRLIQTGYDPETEGLLHDNCWRTYRRMLKQRVSGDGDDLMPSAVTHVLDAIECAIEAAVPHDGQRFTLLSRITTHLVQQMASLHPHVDAPARTAR